MRNDHVRKLAICAIAVAVNVLLGTLTDWMSIPLVFLDTMGTIFVAATIGMPYGILTGVATNLVMALFTGATAIPFALVNVAVAIVVALFAAGPKGFTLPRALLAGIVLSIVCPAIGTPIRMVLFGGFTGSGTDIVILALQAAGKELFSSVFLGAIAGNLVDKILSCLLVALLLKSPGIQKLLPQRKKAAN